jgi:hypothetical protein
LLGFALATGVGVAGATAANAAVCDGVSVPCAIGDTGPGGGTVFYDAGSRQSWGRYLEAAPAKWAKGDNGYHLWCGESQKGYDRKLATSTRIGTGLANTRLIIRFCGKDNAAGAAAGYRGGGKTDWFLPSKGELNQLFIQRKVVGGFPGEQELWSSSQAAQLTPRSDLPDGPTGRSAETGSKSTDAALPVSAWAQDFMTGQAQSIWKWGAGNLLSRPVRAF